jgi:hypothetical protein
MFTRALHLTLSWVRSIQFIPSHPISLRNILILSTHLCSVLPSDSFLLTFSSIFYMHSSPPHSCYMSCPSHPPWLDPPNYIQKSVQVMELLNVQICPTSCHFLSLWSKYPPQHPILKHPLSIFLPSCAFSLAQVIFPKNLSQPNALCDILHQACFYRWGVSPKLNP